MLGYRFLSEDEGAGVWHEVSAALDRGWQLHGQPTYAFDAARGVMRCGQAVVKEVDGTYDPAIKLGDL